LGIICEHYYNHPVIPSSAEFRNFFALAELKKELQAQPTTPTLPPPPTPGHNLFLLTMHGTTEATG
jgi:hypothetical protein